VEHQLSQPTGGGYDPTFYEAYIQSPEWKQMAVRIRERQGNRCKLCGRDSALDVHHHTYSRLGHERDGDLVGLCRRCHEKLHLHVQAYTFFGGFLSKSESLPLAWRDMQLLMSLPPAARSERCNVCSLEQNISPFDLTVWEHLATACDNCRQKVVIFSTSWAEGIDVALASGLYQVREAFRSGLLTRALADAGSPVQSVSKDDKPLPLLSGRTHASGRPALTVNEQTPTGGVCLFPRCVAAGKCLGHMQ